MTVIVIEMETVISTSMTTAPCWRTLTRRTVTVTAGVMIATTASVSATEIRYVCPHSICHSIPLDLSILSKCKKCQLLQVLIG